MNNERLLPILKELGLPILDFLYEYGTPHSKIIITQNGIELLDGTIATPFELRD